MAILKSSTINGTLSVPGKITSNVTAPAQSHVTNKKYVDTIGAVLTHDVTISDTSTFRTAISWVSVSSVSNSSNQRDILDVTLTPGNYLINYSCGVRASGSGFVVMRMNKTKGTSENNSEILRHPENVSSSDPTSKGEYTRSSAPCTGSDKSTINGSFIYTCTSSERCYFHLVGWGNTSWRPIDAYIAIAPLNAGASITEN